MFLVLGGALSHLAANDLLEVDSIGRGPTQEGESSGV